MPVVVIKAKAGSPSHLEKLVARVNQKASGLLEGRNRVLVVYAKQVASIYYEGQHPAVRSSREALS